jgi:hypothetical protein
MMLRSGGAEWWRRWYWLMVMAVVRAASRERGRRHSITVANVNE